VEYAPPVVERLDEERLETLRAWGAGLSTNARDELRAAGKAILMLVDEIDRLEADLWNGRAEAKQATAQIAGTQPPPEPEPAPLEAVEPHATKSAKPSRAARQRPTAVPPPAPRDRRSPTAEPSQVLAMTLSERIAQGRPAPSEPAA
jgi:hypothetical protein